MTQLDIAKPDPDQEAHDRQEVAAQDWLDAVARGEDPKATEPPDEGPDDPRPLGWETL